MKLIVTTTMAAALLAGCSTNRQDSLLVATKLVQANAVDPADPGKGCAYKADTLENTFGLFDPSAGYVHAVVVENRLQDNSNLSLGRFNTNEFQVEGATIKTDVLVGPAQNIPDQTVPANGLIQIGQSAPVAIQLAQPGAIAVGSEVRFHIQVFGRLLAGSTVKTNTYEYSAAADTIAPGNPCAVGRKGRDTVVSWTCDESITPSRS